MRWSLLLGLLLAASAARGVEVLSVDPQGTLVTIGPSFGIPWTVGESVCFFRGMSKLACGWVFRRVYEGAQVRLALATKPEDAVKPRDSAERGDVGAQVFEVITPKKSGLITHGPRHRWSVGDTVCFYRKQDPLGCGEISKTDPFTSRVDLFWSSGNAFDPGDEVRDAPGKSRVVKVSDTAGDIVVGQALAKPWKLGETLAVMKAGVGIAWGEVTKIYPLTVEVQIYSSKESFDEGDWVKPMPLPIDISKSRPKTPERETAGVSETFTFRDDHREIFSVGLMTLILNARYERAIFPRVTLGGTLLVVGQALGGGRVSGVGVLGTITYYPRVFPKGLWLQMGAGFGPLTLARAGLKDTFISPFLSTTGGWRWQWGSGLTVGAGVGAMFFPSTSTARVFLNHSGVLPTVQFDLGMVF